MKLKQFEEYLKDRVSPGTLKVYLYALRRWAEILNGSEPTRESTQAYIDALTKKGRSASTVALHGHAIMRYFKWRGDPISLDCPTIRMREPEYLIMEQIQEVMNACVTPLESAIVVGLFDTAVRVSELLSLELDDIDRVFNLISVIRKGGRREEVNISEKALKALDNWLDARQSRSKRVFMDMTYYDAWLLIRAIGKRVGIKLHPHIFRHSRAIHMLMSGASMYTVKDHLGHKSIATTINIYGRFRAVDLKEAIPEW